MSITANSKESVTLEQEFQTRWKEAAEDFSKITKGKRLDAKCQVTPLALAELLRSKEEAGSSEKWGNLSKVVGATCKILLGIGSIAASIGSFAFPPSEMAMNAVNFFVQAAVKYGQIFKNLNLLFERIASALERFEIYSSNQVDLPQGVRKVAHEILLRLVSTCGVAYRVLKASKVKVFVGAALFGSDTGVQAELKALDDLTYKEALTNAAYNVVNSTKAMNIAEDDKQTKFLIQYLGKEHQDEEWRRHMARTSITPEPGTWIKDNKTFNRWISTNQDPILFLSGAEATGKSILMSRIVEILQGLKNEIKGVRVAYFFTSDGDKSSPEGSHTTSKTQDQGKSTLDIALRAMALQLSKKDDVYRKNLITTLQKHASQYKSLTTDVKQLFELLFVESVASFSFFLLFDDLHELSDLQTAMVFLACIDKQISQTNQSKLKILATTRRESDIDIYQKSQESKSKVLQIDLGLENKDIARYAQYQVAELPDLSNPAFDELRADIEDTLSSRRSFKEVDLILSAIRDKQREKDIRRVLTEFKMGAGTRGAVVNLLQRCSNLDEDNIKDLNTLLEWVLCDISYPLNVDRLAEIVQFRNPSPSIKPLRKRINEEFRDFFNIDEKTGRVTIATEAIKSYFEEFTGDARYTEKYTKALVTAAEVSIVKRMLKYMCDEELYEKLGFDAFFREKTQTTFKVHVNVKEMHAQVALDCMKCIVSGSEPTVKIIMRFFWYEVFSKADPAQINHRLKREIGKVLIPMLCEDDAIDSWQPWRQPGHNFITKQKFTQVVMKWLEDSVVQEGVSEVWQKQWVENIASSPAEPFEKIWQSVVQRIARWWLVEAVPDDFTDDTPIRYSHKFTAFRWIQAFLQQTFKGKKSGLNLYNWYDNENTELDDIEEVIAWAKEASKIDEFSASTLCKIGEMYFEFGKHLQAVEKYSLAEQLDDSLHMATSCKAHAEWKQHNYEKAILILKSAIEKQESQSSDYEESIYAHQRTLADWYTTLETYQEALQIYSKLLETWPGKYELIDATFNVCGKVGNHQKTKSFLDTLAAEADEVYSDRLIGLIIYNSEHEEWSRLYRLFDLAKKVGCLKLVNKKLHEAIAISKSRLEEERSATEERWFWIEESRVASMFFLYSIGARWLHRYHLNKNEQEEAFAYGKNAVELYRNLPSRIQDDTDPVAVWLCQRYLSQAKDFPCNSSEERGFIDKVQGLCLPENIHDTEEKFPLLSRNVNDMLGFYYADRKQLTLAMECLKSEVETGIELLSNETKEDDWWGFIRLATAFMRCNDERNATAAFSLIGPNNQSEAEQSLIEPKIPSQTSSPVEQLTSIPDRPSSRDDALEEDRDLELPGLMEASCDGGCGRTYTYGSDMYWCKNCPDVQFDKDCFYKLRRGELDVIVCDPGHKFFYTPPWDASKSKELGEDMVDVGGDIMTIEQWKAEIRKTWGISIQETQDKKTEESEEETDGPDNDDDD